MIANVTSSGDFPGRASRPSEQAVPLEANPDSHRQAKGSGTDAHVNSPPAQDTLEEAVARIQDLLQQSNPCLQIEIDRDLHRVVVKVMNGDSGEVIRQIPSKALLELAKHLTVQKGLLLQEQA